MGDFVNPEVYTSRSPTGARSVLKIMHISENGKDVLRLELKQGECTAHFDCSAFEPHAKRLAETIIGVSALPAIEYGAK